MCCPVAFDKAQRSQTLRYVRNVLLYDSLRYMEVQVRVLRLELPSLRLEPSLCYNRLLDSAIILSFFRPTLGDSSYHPSLKYRMDSNACEMPAFGDLINLSVEKLEELGTILASILALPLARDTFAQIIDGSPIRTPYSDDFKARRSPLTKTIIVSDKTKPSENAIHEYERIRTDFTIHILRVDLKVRTGCQVQILAHQLNGHSLPKNTKTRRRAALNTV